MLIINKYCTIKKNSLDIFPYSRSPVRKELCISQSYDIDIFTRICIYIIRGSNSHPIVHLLSHVTCFECTYVYKSTCTLRGYCFIICDIIMRLYFWILYTHMPNIPIIGINLTCATTFIIIHLHISKLINRSVRKISRQKPMFCLD